MCEHRQHPVHPVILRPHARDARGQALVEFALVLPILLLIIFGIFDAGRLIYTYNTVSNSSRDAARVAIVNQSPDGTNTCDTESATAYPVGCAISSGTALGLKKADIDVTYTDPSDTGDCQDQAGNKVILMGCVATVTVTATYQPLTPVIGQLIGTIDVSSTTKMPIERPCANPTAAPLAHC